MHSYFSHLNPRFLLVLHEQENHFPKHPEYTYVTNAGNIVGTSTDGIIWTNRPAGTTTLTYLTTGNNIIIAGGASGYVGTSSNTLALTSLGYDTTTQFFVPSLTNQGTFGTVTLGSQPVQTTFIKARR